MNFEWTLRVGDILTLGGGVMIAAAFFYRQGGSDRNVDLTLDIMAKQLAEMKSEFSEFTVTLREVAVQKEQIRMLMKWYDELRRGIGIIHTPDREG